MSSRFKEPDVGLRISLSFLSIILLASAVILGPAGAWLVGTVSLAGRWRGRTLVQLVFNVAMSALIAVAGASAYRVLGGQTDVAHVTGVSALFAEVGAPLLLADVVQCLTNAVLLAGVIRAQQGIPFLVTARRVLATSGVAYVGYGIIGFLFVILWFPGQLGPFSAVLILAPLLAARWAFIQVGEELRSHEHTLDALLTALGSKEPLAVGRSRRTARLSEWLAEESGLGPHQIGTVRQAATLHEIGHLGVPARVLRRPPESLSDPERRVLELHGVIGARMIEGIDFLEDARSGIRHQHERFDGSGSPDRLGAGDIPVAGRIVAVAGAFDLLTQPRPEGKGLTPAEALALLEGDVGHYDPELLDVLRAILGKHPWPPPLPAPPSQEQDEGDPEP